MSVTTYVTECAVKKPRKKSGDSCCQHLLLKTKRTRLSLVSSTNRSFTLLLAIGKSSENFKKLEDSKRCFPPSFVVTKTIHLHKRNGLYSILLHAEVKSMHKYASSLYAVCLYRALECWTISLLIRYSSKVTSPRSQLTHSPLECSIR